MRRIEEAFLESFANYPELKTEHILGRMILSAILYGGLLQQQWLDPWVVALNKGVRLDGFCLWLELEKIWTYAHKSSDGKDGDRKRSKEEPILMKRRWFADPISKTLILRWHSLGEERTFSNNLPNTFDLIRGFLSAVNVSPEVFPKNTRRLLSMAETRFGLVVSPFLASYASGWLKSVSVPSETWAEVVLWQHRVSQTNCRT